MVLDGLGNVEPVGDAYNMENEDPPFPRNPDAG